MIPGTVTTLGGKKYVMPPMNVAVMEKHDAFLKKALSGDIDGVQANAMDNIVAIADLVFLSLKRNYPEITAEEVKECVDFGNMPELMSLLFKTSGFVTSAGE